MEKQDLKAMTQTVSNMAGLGEEYQKELKKLEISLVLDDLWPEVFAEGPAKTSWINSAKEGVQFKVTREDGQFRLFNFKEVPELIIRDEAKRRGITGKNSQRNERPTMNNAENRAIWEFMSKEGSGN